MQVTAVRVRCSEMLGGEDIVFSVIYPISSSSLETVAIDGDRTKVERSIATRIALGESGRRVPAARSLPKAGAVPGACEGGFPWFQVGIADSMTGNEKRGLGQGEGPTCLRAFLGAGGGLAFLC